METKTAIVTQDYVCVMTSVWIADCKCSQNHIIIERLLGFKINCCSNLTNAEY